MQWFRNRKTAVKLSIAFAVMAVLMGVQGYEGLQSANTLNHMIDELYAKHMAGAKSIHEARAMIPTIGRGR